MEQLRKIRRRKPDRPTILTLTCLHEAYPQQQHPQPYPFRLPSTGDETAAAVPDNLRRSVAAQTERFQGLFDDLVLVDLTPVEEGFAEPHYGGPFLKEVILKSLPEAFRQSLLTLEQATKTLQDYYSREALPYILGFSSLAATAGAIPMPWIDLLILPGIQTQMIYHLARLYGQPLSGERFLELSGTLGMGIAWVKQFASWSSLFHSSAHWPAPLWRHRRHSRWARPSAITTARSTRGTFPKLKISKSTISTNWLSPARFGNKRNNERRIAVSLAPRLAASMIPGPPPVITVEPRLPSTGRSHCQDAIFVFLRKAPRTEHRHTRSGEVEPAKATHDLDRDAYFVALRTTTWHCTQLIVSWL